MFPLAATFCGARGWLRSCERYWLTRGGRREAELLRQVADVHLHRLRRAALPVIVLSPGMDLRRAADLFIHLNS